MNPSVPLVKPDSPTLTAPAPQLVEASACNSQTLYQTIKNHRDSYARVKLEPVTGRTHQLRAHMAAIGHPIVGCHYYGNKEAATTSDRLHLHASELEFVQEAGEV